MTLNTLNSLSFRAAVGEGFPYASEKTVARLTNQRSTEAFAAELLDMETIAAPAALAKGRKAETASSKAGRRTFPRQPVERRCTQ